MNNHRFDSQDWCFGCGQSREHVVDTKATCTGQQDIIPALYLQNRRRSQGMLRMIERIVDMQPNGCVSGHPSS